MNWWKKYVTGDKDGKGLGNYHSRGNKLKKIVEKAPKPKPKPKPVG